MSTTDKEPEGPKAQDTNHEQQPEYAKVFGRMILDGGHLGVRVEIGEPPLLEAAVVHRGEWHPFL